MEDLASSIPVISTGHAGSGSLGSKLTKAPALDSPETPRPSLETLPVELQRLIMCHAADLISLSALIHASPKLHRVYAQHRRSVLRDLVTQTLDGIHLDALDAYRSGTEAFQKTRTEPLLWNFVEEQQAIRFADPPPPAGDWTAGLSLDDIICILRFHASVVEPLTGAFASWALGELPSTPENKGAYKSAPLSYTERRRIQRALYRMQMVCNLCGSQEAARSAPPRIDDTEGRMRVLSMFPAWGVEEILSVHEFAKDHYQEIFKKVAWDLNEERNPKYRHIDITSVNEDLMLTMELPDGSLSKYPLICLFQDPSLTCGVAFNEKSLNTVLRYGLHLLAETSKDKSHEQMVEMIRTAINSGDRSLWTSFNHAWLDPISDMGDIAQESRRVQWPNRYDSAQDSRQKTPFSGDNLSSPPLAWVLFWQGEYSNVFAEYVPRALRRWGFVIWDAARLDSDARDAIERGWCEKGYNLWDPREDDYDSSVAGSPSSPYSSYMSLVNGE